MIVADLMTRAPPVVQAGATLADAVRIMLMQHVSGLPVQNAIGDLVGIVTEGDFLNRPELGTESQERGWIKAFITPGSGAEDYVRRHGRYVHEVMTTNVFTVTPNTPLSDAADLMKKKHLKCLPVMDAGKLVGIMNRSDFLKALILELVAIDSNKPTKESIHTHIIDGLMHESWVPNSNIFVDVSGEAVTLRGTVVDDLQRKAVAVIAENTPGVKVVHNNLTLEDPGNSVGF